MNLVKLSDDQILNITNSWFDSVEHILDIYGSYTIPRVEYAKLCKNYISKISELSLTDVLDTEGLSQSKDTLDKYLLVSELRDLCAKRRSSEKPLTATEELYVTLRITIIIMGNDSEIMRKLDIIASCLCKRKPIVSKLAK